jgi:hypothetical protein
MHKLYFNLTNTETIQICSVLLALTTCIYAIKSFIRNRKQELENHLFKIKIEALSNLAYEMDNFFITLNRSIVKFSLIEKIQDEEKKHNELLELSLDTDEQLYKCHSMIAKYSVFFTNVSNQKLLEFSSNILGNIDHDEVNEENDFLIEYYRSQQILADKAYSTLREELKLEKLHSSLHLRYK